MANAEDKKKVTPEDLDVDAAKAARREAQGKNPIFTFGGETFTLPIELPFSIMLEVEELGDAPPSLVLRGLLEEEQWEKFKALKPTMDDIEVLFKWIDEVYGMTVGNS